METRDQIIDAFISHLREHGQPPASVYRFCKDAGIEERAFFSEFPSFDAVEGGFWRDSVDRVAKAVASGAEWAGFTARQRLLTFLFAYFEDALNYRSLLLSRFGTLGPLARPVWLRSFEGRFKEFAESLIAHGVETGEIADRGKVASAYPEVFYLHFRACIDFNLKDESPAYERTDAFIEKTVAVAFDAIRTQVFDSIFDLARFFIPRSQGRTE